MEGRFLWKSPIMVILASKNTINILSHHLLQFTVFYSSYSLIWWASRGSYTIRKIWWTGRKILFPSDRLPLGLRSKSRKWTFYPISKVLIYQMYNLISIKFLLKNISNLKQISCRASNSPLQLQIWIVCRSHKTFGWLSHLGCFHRSIYNICLWPYLKS